MKLLVSLLILLFSLGFISAQNLSTRSFTNNNLGSDPNALTIDGNTIEVDLSAIAGAEIYRATLDPYQRPERYYDVQPNHNYNLSELSLNPYVIISASQDTLELLGPRFLVFDATEAVQNAIASGLLVLQIVNDGQGFGNTISLDVMCNQPAPIAVQQVSGTQARFEAGETMITFHEINPINDNAVWTQSGYLDALVNIYMHDISPKRRYRIYRSEAPVNSIEDVISAELIDEIMPMSGWNYTSRLQSDTIYMFPVAHMEFAEPGTGIYVHRRHLETPDSAWYFVSHTLNGAEDFSILATDANISNPVEEAKGPGMVIKWREEVFNNGWYWWPDRNPTLQYFTRWEAPPYWNLPSKGFNYRVGFPNEEYLVDRPALEVSPHWWGGNYSDFAEWWSFEQGGLLLTMNHLYYNSYTAFNENITTLKPWDEGTVQPFYQARVSSFITDFLIPNFNIDTNKLIMTGGSMGGAAGHFWGMRSGRMFNYIISVVGNNIPAQDPCCIWEFETWGGYGKKDWDLSFSNIQMARFGHDPVYPVDNYSVWDYYDNTQWLELNPATETPFISFSNSTDDPAIGWEQAWLNANSVYETKRPHAFFWGADGHNWYIGWADIPTALNQSLPAFSNCTLDDDLGATPGQATEGQRNQYLRWDSATITDETHLWEIYLYLHSSAPFGTCTADLTPRRLQRFEVMPGESYDWKTDESGVLIQSGQVTANEHGLITITGLEINQNLRRLIIEPVINNLQESKPFFELDVFGNPFHEKISLSFFLDKPQRLSLEIYDTHGKVLEAAHYIYETPGRYSITWNGTDRDGTDLAPGIYLVHLTGDSHSEIVRVVKL